MLEIDPVREDETFLSRVLYPSFAATLARDDWQNDERDLSISSSSSLLSNVCQLSRDLFAVAVKDRCDL